MTRRIFRTIFQLGALLTITLLLLLLLDSRYRVLPQSIHSHLPAHHPGLVITDITVKTCSTANPFSVCKLDPDVWHQIPRDLYLGKSWFGKAYVHIKRKKEEELSGTDKVVLDVKVSRLDPAMGEKAEQAEKWEARPCGIWLKRSDKKKDSDSRKVITAVDVLFGADAVEPRPGWELRDTPLLLGTSGEMEESKLSVRRGPPPKVEKPVPRIKRDSKFKILQVADLHLSTGLGNCRDPEPKSHDGGGRCDADPRTLEFVRRVLDDEKPDMVVLTGDQVNGDTAPDAQSAIFKFAELLISRKIPYATIFGNHDDEGSLPRATQMSLIETLPYSLSEAGPENIDGVGNYYVEVLGKQGSHHSALTLYFLDTHSYSPDDQHFKGYDWLKPSQIEWFRRTSSELHESKAHKEYTFHHLDLAFIHIPLPEYTNAENHWVGDWKEGVTAPGFNSHMYDALVDNHVLAVSCGHDHVNDYCMLGKNEKERPELWMCYGGGSGFGGYGGYGGYVRRLRVFDIDAGLGRINTWKRLEYGDINKRIDQQIIVDGGKVVAGSQ